MGIVIETGSGVSLFKKGDRIVMPFNVGDGRCWNCEEVGTAFCTGVNPYGSFPFPYPYVHARLILISKQGLRRRCIMVM